MKQTLLLCYRYHEDSSLFSNIDVPDSSHCSTAELVMPLRVQAIKGMKEPAWEVFWQCCCAQKEKYNPQSCRTGEMIFHLWHLDGILTAAQFPGLAVSTSGKLSILRAIKGDL